MRLRSKLTALGLLVVLASGAARAQAPADEAALLNIWKTLGPSNNDVTARACAAFQKQFAQSPLSYVTRGLVGWYALQVGDCGDRVVQLYEGMVSDSKDPFPEAASTMARRWLSRLDREKVKVALRKIYVDHVTYPASLDELAKLPAESRPPLNDRWGRPWRYHLADMKYIRGAAGQKFVLESSNMDRDHELRDALKKTYDVATLLKPQKILSREKGRETVNFAAGREPVGLTVGGHYRGVTLAYVGQTLVVLSDDDHWSVLPLP
jgi:hypothetical protein